MPGTTQRLKEFVRIALVVCFLCCPFGLLFSAAAVPVTCPAGSCRAISLRKWCVFFSLVLLSAWALASASEKASESLLSSSTKPGHRFVFVAVVASITTRSSRCRGLMPLVGKPRGRSRRVPCPQKQAQSTEGFGLGSASLRKSESLLSLLVHSAGQRSFRFLFSCRCHNTNGTYSSDLQQLVGNPGDKPGMPPVRRRLKREEGTARATMSDMKTNY